MTHDNSYPVATKAMNLGLTKIHDGSQIVMGTVCLDHPLLITITATDDANSS